MNTEAKQESIDEKKFSTREMILAMRGAFVGGYRRMGGSAEYGDNHARVAFPLPKVERMREVSDVDGDVWRLNEQNGRLEVRYPADGQNGEWETILTFDIRKEYFPAVAELFRQPTELVDA